MAHRWVVHPVRPEHPNHVWSYDFVGGRTHDGRMFRMLNVIDEFTRDCLAIRINRKLKAADVIDVCPICSSCAASLAISGLTTGLNSWPRLITAVGVKTDYVERSSPWENG